MSGSALLLKANSRMCRVECNKLKHGCVMIRAGFPSCWRTVMFQASGRYLRHDVSTKLCKADFSPSQWLPFATAHKPPQRLANKPSSRVVMMKVEDPSQSSNLRVATQMSIPQIKGSFRWGVKEVGVYIEGLYKACKGMVQGHISGK